MNRFAADGPLFRPDDSIQWLQRARDAGGVFRVFDLAPLLGAQSAYGQNDLAVHGLEQLAGHHGNELGSYRRLIGGEHAENLLHSELRLADITNTEYFLIPGRVDDPRLEEVHAGTYSVVYRNRNALPRAYLVGEAEVVPGDAGIQRLLAADFDPRRTAVLDSPLPAGTELQPDAGGAVEWVSREVDRFTLRVQATAPALLVVLDNHYPAWEAAINGRVVPILRANHTFRAVPVPAGEHTVTFRYTPDALGTGAVVSIVALTLLFVTVAAGTVRRPLEGSGAA
jgi:hypothetical protein